MALSHLGIGKEIANITTEQSQEAAACRRFYDTARDATLRDFNWPFCSKIIALSLIEEDPTDEWKYSYRYPSDCLHLKRILSGARNDTHQSRVEFKILKDSAAHIIYTDIENAEAEYTERVSDPSFYPSDFQLALSYRIAHYIAPRLTKGDPFKIKADMMKLYDLELSRAQATALNEEQQATAPDAEFIRIREG